MLRLFQSIFGVETKKGNYPESLIREAIERAVDGTDPSLRGLLRYRNKLREPVLRAIDHVVGLVDDFADPLEASRASFGCDPLLRTFFVSADQMEQVFRENLEPGGFLPQPDAKEQKVCGLLVMQKEERTIFGADLVGETVVRDVVPQVTVSFSAHQLLDPTKDESQTRRMLKRRAFDHLLSLALGRISRLRDQGAGLQKRHDLLQAKLNRLQQGRWGFDFPAAERPPDVAELEAKLSQIEKELLQIGWGADNLKVSLDTLCDVLNHPESYLWSGRSKIVVDRMGIKHEKPSDDSPELDLQLIYNAEGRSVVVSLVWLHAQAAAGKN